MRIKRMWVNQPSSLQPYHKYNGVNVLADEEDETVYFLSGKVISMRVPLILWNSLSKGWTQNNEQTTNNGRLLAGNHQQG